MAAKQPPKRLALDTNVVLDLAAGLDAAHDFKEAFQARGYSLLLPPTAAIELHDAFENGATLTQRDLARQALLKVRAWDIVPVDLTGLEIALAERFAARLHAARRRLEAFARFRPRQPKALLAIIGPETQPAYAAQLRDFVAANELGGCVRMLPGLRHDDADLVNAYHACDALVLPFMHEPFGIVVLEAWAAGRPVIVNRVGGLEALVDHGHNGLFITLRGVTGGLAHEL